MHTQNMILLGTMRYMSPEVCLDEPYGLECDIYSYGILCWEVWTHNIPFDELTPSLYRTWVCRRGYRPPDHDRDFYYTNNATTNSFNVFPPQEVCNLLSQTWKHNPYERIRWCQIQNQFELMKRSEQLQMKECRLLLISSSMKTTTENKNTLAAVSDSSSSSSIITTTTTASDVSSAAGNDNGSRNNNSNKVNIWSKRRRRSSI